MSADVPDTNPPPVPVATGDRRDEVHFEPDPGQLVVAKHLVKPDHPLAADLQLAEGKEGDAEATAAKADVPPVEDALVAPEAPSVWDARPPADEESGNLTAP